MDTHGDTAVQNGVGKVFGSVGIIQGVTAFVHHAVQGGGEVVFLVIGGNADIVMGAQTGGEGMLRDCQTAVIPVQTQQVHEIVGQGLLLVGREEAVNNGVADLRPGSYLPQQGNQTGAEGGEEVVADLPGQAVLIFAQPEVIGVFLRSHIAGKADIGLKNLLQNGAEQRKIAGFLGPVPHIVGLHQQLLVGHILVHGNLPHLTNILQHQIDHALLFFRQLSPVGIQKFQQGNGLFAGGQLVMLGAEDGQGLSPVGGGTLGGGGGAVIMDQAHGVAVSAELGLQGHQFLLCLCNGHGSVLLVLFDCILLYMVRDQMSIVSFAGNRQRIITKSGIAHIME